MHRTTNENDELISLMQIIKPNSKRKEEYEQAKERISVNEDY
jgi:hypothetical protein